MSPQRVSCEGYYRRKPGRRRVEVTVENDNGRHSSAAAANVEVVMASVAALLNAINHRIRLREAASYTTKSGSKNADVA